MLSVCFVAVLAFGAVRSANIMVIVTVPSHSHHLWNVKYFTPLLERGHHVTYLSIDQYPNPPANLTHVFMDGVYENVYSNIDMNLVGLTGPYGSMKILNVWDVFVSEGVTKSTGFKTFLEKAKGQKFDLVVYDLGSTPFMLGIVDYLGRVPVMAVTAFGVPSWAMQMAGNPMPFTDAPHFLLPYSNKMNFWQRLDNFLLFLYSFYQRHQQIESQDVLSKKIFGSNTRHLTDIMNDVNIVLVNQHYGTDYAFPMVPGVVGVPGLHVTPAKPLPTDLQKYLDDAKDGVIYFSLGSNVQSIALSNEKISIFKNVFRKLAPVKVLWKWESDELPGKPDNVETKKWLPQNDILAHPNVKLFFTHSGLLSTQEATYHGVPMVGMPFFLDQHVNVRQLVLKTIGIEVNFDKITEESLYTALKTVLEDPKYQNNMKKLSEQYKDSLNSPKDLAVYWTEYAIRHRGAPHLRPASRDLAWYQQCLLDIVLVAIVIPLLILVTVFKLLKRLLRSQQKDSQKQKRQ